MTELTRYNAVPKIIGQDMNVEYEADPNGQLVFADGAITRVRELEKERDYFRGQYHAELAKSAARKEAK